MLRGSLHAAPLTDFKVFVDHDQYNAAILNNDTAEQRWELAREAENLLMTAHHRPLLERQRRAKSEFEALSIRYDHTP